MSENTQIRNRIQKNHFIRASNSVVFKYTLTYTFVFVLPYYRLFKGFSRISLVLGIIYAEFYCSYVLREIYVFLHTLLTFVCLCISKLIKIEVHMCENEIFFALYIIATLVISLLLCYYRCVIFASFCSCLKHSFTSYKYKFNSTKFMIIHNYSRLYVFYA